ncbi:CzcE family metal-binding protein [Paracidovorax oryzae]|uniref:CzcE family metal-binding protein n=1 Tax=Paracidovorax oryzae TaxID=862720 RepID=UPI00068C5989|nr:CzcE family metal-binding protein [Paracidovorax oryzae]
MSRIRITLLSALSCAALIPAAASAYDVVHNAPTEAGYTLHPDHARSAAAMPAAAGSSMGSQAMLGRPASPDQASRTVDASRAGTLNVKCGETIAFRSGDKTFAWKFDVFSHRPVELAAISPREFNAGPVQVYVTPNEGERN